MHERFVIHVLVVLRRLRLPVQHERRPEGHRFHDLDALELRVLVIDQRRHPHAHAVVGRDLLVEPEGARHLRLLLVVGVGHGVASVSLRLACCCVLCLLQSGVLVLLRANLLQLPSDATDGLTRVASLALMPQLCAFLAGNDKPAASLSKQNES